MDVLAVLGQAGIGAIDHRVASAPGGFTPVGVLLHHTASRIAMDPMPSLRVVQHGRSDLPGPLCNVLIGRDAKVAVITDGRANDSGAGDPCVYAAVVAGRTLPTPDDREGHRVNGNSYFYDIEVENDGVGEAWSQPVIEVTVAVAATLCRHHRWGSDRVLGHREWTRRKIDPSERGDWRGRVEALLNPTKVAAMEASYIRELHEVYLGLNPDARTWTKPEVASFNWHLARLQTGTSKEAIRADFAATAVSGGRL